MVFGKSHRGRVLKQSLLYAVIIGLGLTVAQKSGHAAQSIFCWVQDMRRPGKNEIIMHAQINDEKANYPSTSRVVGVLEVSDPYHFGLTIADYSDKFILKMDAERGSDSRHDLIFEASSSFGVYRLAVPHVVLGQTYTGFTGLLKYTRPDVVGPVENVGECISIMI